ncbi:MAG: T9SS type A sorting domain-containing protein [Chitinophagaceae bacterium]|nr:T9SS type A sorting domain-containing protein [Chitinophagaceae bacterium]
MIQTISTSKIPISQSPEAETLRGQKVFRSSTISNAHQIATNTSFLVFNESGALTAGAEYGVQFNNNSYTENCQNPNSGSLNLQEAEQEEFVDYIQSVVADSVQYINYDEVGSWINQYRVYTTLDIDSALRYSENGLLNFYTARQNMNIGRLRETDRLIEILFDSTTDAGNFGIRFQEALAANNQINSGEEWELNEKRMNEALIYSSATPLDSLEQSLKEDIASLALSCPFVAGQAVYKARRIWSFWQPNALFDDRVLCLQTENKNGEGVIEDIDDYYNLQIVRSHQSEDVINTPSITNENNSIEATRVYPNPAKSNLNIILGRNLPATFVLFNAVGERVLAQPLFETENSLELDKHPAGFYHYLIQYVDGGNETGKLTIQ